MTVLLDISASNNVDQRTAPKQRRSSLVTINTTISVTMTPTESATYGGAVNVTTGGSLDDLHVPSDASSTLLERDQAWEENFQQLVDYCRIHGHFIIPQEDKPVLFRFVKNLRQNYKYTLERRNGSTAPAHETQQHSITASSRAIKDERTPYMLTPERIRQLDEIGFAWTPRDDQWELKYRRLEEFWQIHGHLKVPSHPETQTSDRIKHDDHQQDRVSLEDDTRTALEYAELRSWMTYQRTRYFNRNGKQRPLSEDQITKLKSIGFRWTPHDEKWWANFAELKSFKQAHGHLEIKGSENHKLRCWKNTLRSQCKEYILSVTLEGTSDQVHVSGLNAERLRALADLRFCWLPPIQKGPLLQDPPEDIFAGYQ